MAVNWLPPKGLIKRLYRNVLNRFVIERRTGRTVQYFGYLRAHMIRCACTGGKVIELMTHPGIDSDYEVLNSRAYATFLERHELVGYPRAIIAAPGFVGD